MSDTPKPPESVPEPATPPEKPASRRAGAVAAICDALKELFEHAPKRALGWVCAGVAMFVVLAGVGVMSALILYGWPSMATKQPKNWELVGDAAVPVVELREMDEGGAVTVKKVEVPKGVADPHKWAIERYGEQRPLTLKEMPLIPMDDKPPVDNQPGKEGVPQ